jgi:hypothetical protein
MLNPHSDLTVMDQPELEPDDKAPPWNAHDAADEIMRRLGCDFGYVIDRGEYTFDICLMSNGGQTCKHDDKTALLCVKCPCGVTIEMWVEPERVENFIRIVEFARSLENTQ